MKKRNPAAVLLLPFVTFGIYCFYWLYATRKEIIAKNGNKKSIPPVSLLFLPTLGFIVLIAIMFIISASTNSSTTAHTLVGIFTFIIGVFGFLGILAIPLWWFWRYCQAVSDLTRTEFGQLYVLYVVITWVCGLMPVWMLIVQLDLNKSIDHEAHTHEQHTAAAHTEHHEHHALPQA